MNNGCYCLYVHTVIPNGKRYVGITSKTPQERWRNGNGYRRSFFEKAIRKYGWENIRHDVLRDDLTKEKAINMEQDLIRILKTADRDCGYNISLGGEVAANGVKSYAYKLKQSLNTHKQWESKKAKLTYRKPPRQKKCEYRKAVYQYDSSGELINVFESVHDAAEHLGVNETSVSEACNTDGRKCKGFMLRFENDGMKSNGVRGGWIAKPVIQIGIDGNEVERFKSASQAAKKFGRSSPCTILDACKGKQITAYGYIWRLAKQC